MAEPCSMCAARPATKSWGLPVCDPCFAGLVELDVVLKAEEAADPDLAARAQRVEDACRAYVEGRSRRG